VALSHKAAFAFAGTPEVSAAARVGTHAAIVVTALAIESLRLVMVRSSS
jgi:hypothetical protein